MNKRTAGLLIVLAIVAAAAFWPESEPTRVVATLPTQTSSQESATAPSAESRTENTSAAQRLSIGSADLFASLPSEEPMTAARPKAPVAPPLPFEAVGKWEEAGTQVIFIAVGDRVINVSQGQVLEQSWRLDRIETGQLVFTHLPTKTTQTMRIAP